MERAESTGPAGKAVIEAELLLVAYAALIVDEELDVTGLVVTVNAALDEPPATVTLAGTVATDVLLEDRPTMTPPVGAAPLKVTVPCDGLPPTTLVGLSDTEDTDGGSTVSVADLLLELYEAPMLEEALAPTADVETLKVAVVEPAPTVTLARTVAADVLLEESVTIAPPERAGLLRVTVP